MNQIQALKFYKILKISSTELEKSSSAFKKNLHSGFDGKLFVAFPGCQANKRAGGKILKKH